MTGQETPILIDCAGERLVGLLHRPPDMAPAKPLGVLIPVGGPTYRIGAARQYVVLARTLAQAGYATLRFDYRGVGDGTGAYPGLDGIGPDLSAAIAAFQQAYPHIQGIVPWGLCEAASAILIHGPDLPNIAGAVLANPWLDDETAQARGMIRQHYGKRLSSWQFWRKLLTGGVNAPAAVSGLWATWRRSRAAPQGFDARLGVRMAAGLDRFDRPLLCLLSTADDTATAFDDALTHRPEWRQARAGSNLALAKISDADHVFTEACWRQAVARETIAFLDRLSAASS
ncbi:MAG: hydrolase 1, exosortase A system-associated [Sphingomonadales bacterium]